MSWLGNYQTLVVGFVGFAGVIITLVHNARTARNERNEVREHEREALRTALISELQIIQGSLKENLRQQKERSGNVDGGAFVPTDRMDGAYKSFLPRIGLLTEREVGAVMTAYLTLETFNAKLFLIGVPVSTGPRHVQVTGTHLELLASMQEDVLKPINRAIEVLKEAT